MWEISQSLRGGRRRCELNRLLVTISPQQGQSISLYRRQDYQRGPEYGTWTAPILSRKVLSAVAYLDKEEKNAKKKRHYGQNAVQERFLGPIIVIYGSEKALWWHFSPNVVKALVWGIMMAELNIQQSARYSLSLAVILSLICLPYTPCGVPQSHVYSAGYRSGMSSWSFHFAMRLFPHHQHHPRTSCRSSHLQGRISQGINMYRVILLIETADWENNGNSQR